ncbi:MAG: diaminopimelate epimerase [Paludibacteraceae bacterium]|nr:diaminopimelate epimerase [Paludibacteraceae bacterium]
MSQTIHFTKMHGIGNDYIYVDTALNEIKNPSEASELWSDRHRGIGSDGLVLIGRGEAKDQADFTMRIFNADGSEAKMCGNASRCVGKYLYEKGLTKQTVIRLLTASGIKELHLHVADERVDSVTVDMGEPALSNEAQYIESEELPEGTFVCMGNPHYVIFVEDAEKVDIEKEGKRLEHHKAFPERCNIEFATVREDGIRVRVWERGSGVTMACGTGACATAVAAAHTGRAGRKSRIIMDGGALEIEWAEDSHVKMTGGASFVFDGEIELSE